MSIALPTVDELLLKRARSPGRAYRIGEKGIALDGMAFTPTMDGAAMSATAVISTPTPDNSDDVVNPVGCDLGRYRNNPLVLWNHGFELTLPVGRAVDPDGNLCVTITDAGIESTCFFSQSLFEAQQIYALVDEGIICAASIRPEPKGRDGAIVRSKGKSPDRPGLFIDQWELIEWSWVAVGDNPEAIRKRIDLGKIAGRPIADPILKSLLPFAAQAKGNQAQGVTLPQETPPVAVKTPAKKPITKSDPPVKPGCKADGTPMTDDEKAKAAEDEKAADEQAAKDAKAAEGGEGAEPVTPAEEETDADEPATTPPGAQALSAVHASLSDLLANIDNALRLQENPAVIERLKATAEALQSELAEVEGSHASTYPDAPGLVAKDDMPTEEDEMAKSLVKFLASGRDKQAQLLGMAATIGVLTKHLPKAYQRTGSRLQATLTKALADAKAFKASDAPAADPKLIAELQKALGDNATLMKKFKDSMPTKR